MPRQNRVTPQGELIATPARGMWLGNRGCLHNDAGAIVRPFQLKRWIYCLLSFKNRRRPLMTPGRYTELFFLDEATALAAGHRPCAECQRRRYSEYLDLWRRVHPHEAAYLRADTVDVALHAERIAEAGQQQTHVYRVDDLPDGVMLLDTGSRPVPQLLWRDKLYPWSPSGYGSPRPKTAAGAEVRALTPPRTVAVLARGFAVTVHPSIGSPAKSSGARLPEPERGS